jgi:hypothetical protein
MPRWNGTALCASIHVSIATSNTIHRPNIGSKEYWRNSQTTNARPYRHRVSKCSRQMELHDVCCPVVISSVRRDNVCSDRWRRPVRALSRSGQRNGRKQPATHEN